MRHYIEAYNRGDVKAMTALFAAHGSILDGLAPHVWNGPTACEDWYRDAMVAGEHEGAADSPVPPLSSPFVRPCRMSPDNENGDERAASST
ncbi:nuclear transport factor 2 family protein [Edaphobacter sp. HDX4]